MLIFKAVASPIIRLCTLLFVGFPATTTSGGRWGLLQTFLSIVFFLFGVPALFAFIWSGGGGTMNIFIIVFFSLGLLALIYTAWLGIKFYSASKKEVDPYAKKEDINQLSIKFDILINEIRGLREDLGGRKDGKP